MLAYCLMMFTNGVLIIINIICALLYLTNTLFCFIWFLIKMLCLTVQEKCYFTGLPFNHDSNTRVFTPWPLRVSFDANSTNLLDMFVVVHSLPS